MSAVNGNSSVSFDFNIGISQAQSDRKCEADQKEDISPKRLSNFEWVLLSRDMRLSDAVDKVLPFPIQARPADLNRKQIKALRALELRIPEDRNRAAAISQEAKEKAAGEHAAKYKEASVPLKRPLLDSRVVTAIRFLSDNPEKLPDFPKIAVAAISCIGLGAAAGGPVGVAIGSAVAVTGLALGNISKVLISDEFKRYRTLRHEVLRNELIKDFIKSDDEIRYYLCPLTGELPENPVTVNCDVINPKNLHFDEAAIVNWLTHNPGIIFPNCKAPFAANDLVLDLPFMNSAVARLEKLIQACLNENEIAQIISSLPQDLPFELIELIFTYKGYNVNTIGRILVNTISLSNALMNTRKIDARERIKQIFDREDWSDLKVGQEIGILKSKFSLRKEPLTEEPYFFMKWFGVLPKFTRFVVTYARKEERCLGKDKQFIEKVMKDFDVS